ncbi:hypothetical protein ACFPOI_58585 [Nonomuraea angiospora]|uniref:DNA-binding SARP family transcriptional activator n=1 Tax=Nonomuraea angiospora TaxID=46172 RepID=A0ABR9LQW5_9ACTN|nr:hypothetical protein [Nonomuraea angiospora]MBE1583042.1 DNA-binding SARP family transcriptional activator [Nonomuraea angiospora]
MRVAILGPLEVESAAVGGARLRRLLVRLALAAGRAVTVEALAADLWPEEPPADPGDARQSLVSRLRRTLPEAAALASDLGGQAFARRRALDRACAVEPAAGGPG